MQKTEFTEEIKEDIKQLGGEYKFNQAVIEETYDTLATKYDNIMITMGHPDPARAASLSEDLVSSAGFDPSETKVIDFGCGTGLVGDELVKKGFRTIVGVDAS